MKKNKILEIFLICFLGITGWYLFSVAEKLKSNNPELQEIERNNSLVFMDGVGIDVMGNIVDSVFALEDNAIKRRVAAFLLRYDSIDDDLKFWNEVNRHLAGLDTVRLMAYCENSRCVDVIRKNPDVAHFTVLKYGEAIDMQAVIGADLTGEFWLRGDRSRKINWRDERVTPFDTAMSIGLNNEK